MEKQIGKITHYYDRISVAVLALTDSLKLGDEIRISGHTTDFTQNITSLEIEHDKILTAKPGDEVALKVIDSVRKGDKLYKIIEEVD